MNLCFGEFSRQCMPGVVDTGSPWILARSSKCTACQPPFYDASTSSTNATVTTLPFVDINATGTVAFDTVWLVSPAALKVRLPQAYIFELHNFTSDPDTATDDQATRDALFRGGISGIWGFTPGTLDALKTSGIEGFTICLPRKQTAHGKIVFNPSIPSLAGIP